MSQRLTDRDLELIEVALQSAIAATGHGITRNDEVADLNTEYRTALAHVERYREEHA